MDKSKNSEFNTNTTDNDDFSSSMARLAELAANELGPDKTPDDNTVKIDDELLKEFMKPKRKAKPKTWQEKWAGKSIKLKINPYVASGIMIIFLSVGIIAAPKISKYFEQQRLAKEAEEKRIAMIAKGTENKLKSYNVFDAAKDISGNSKELSATSMSDLLKKVEEGNKAEAERLASENVSQLAMNTLSLEAAEVELDLLDGFSSYTAEGDTLSLNNPELFWDLHDIPENSLGNFDSAKICSVSPSDLPSEESVVSDILETYFVFGGKNC